MSSLLGVHGERSAASLIGEIQEKGLPAGPNSTHKLNLANLIALEQLSSEFEFIHLHAAKGTFSEDFFTNVASGDFIQLHIGPNAHSDFLLNFLIENLEKLKDLQVKLVVGTEVTWKQKVEAGALDEVKLLELLKIAYAVLGHTPKTHMYLYALDSDAEINFVEFPLGLLPAQPTQVAPQESSSPKRRLGMILPQSGRLAKGEALHEEILETMSSAAVRENWDLQVLIPPYNSQEFEDFASKSDLMVNTSLGETFSYQIQEARALGTPVLHPTSTYISRRGEVFIECWPEFGLDFSSLEEVSDILSKFSADANLLSEESERQKKLASTYFSIEQIAQNFRTLYSQTSESKCAVVIACYHRIEDAQALQGACCERPHTIVIETCLTSAPSGKDALRLSERFSQGHASDFDHKRNLIYRRAITTTDVEGTWSKISNDSVWGITLDRQQRKARDVPEFPGLFERLALRLSKAARFERCYCE
jgi:glycosyltransferase involved in cell wall biosynthesis